MTYNTHEGLIAPVENSLNDALNTSSSCCQQLTSGLCVQWGKGHRHSGKLLSGTFHRNIAASHFNRRHSPMPIIQSSQNIYCILHLNCNLINVTHHHSQLQLFTEQIMDHNIKYNYINVLSNFQNTPQQGNQ